MSAGVGMPSERLPTLTEVIELSETQPSSGIDSVTVVDRRVAAMPVSVERRVVAASGPSSARTEEHVVQRVMEELHRQIDLMLEYRLREALAPVLARAADNMVRETRAELASTLRDVVARAVTLEMARHRGGRSGR